MKKKGMALILTLMVITVLTILAGSVVFKSLSEKNLVYTSAKTDQAFWLAEAGISKALYELKNDFNISGQDLWLTSLGQGEFTVDIETLSSSERLVTSYGCIPSTAQCDIARSLQVTIRKYIPPDFYEHAIYSAGDVVFNGNSYDIQGSDDGKAVIYAGQEDIQHPDNITGDLIHDESITPLAMLDFETLKADSIEQGNFYDQARIDAKDPFPEDFWYEEPTDPEDPSTGTPNIVYVTTDLEVKGQIGTIGGFVIVAGDVITDPEDTADATISGQGTINGVIYTRGEFTVNGGGSGISVDGGVWSGQQSRLNGSVNINYNQEYMDAVREYNSDKAQAQIVSWTDIQTPYTLE
jgi:hypothetical protein